MDFYDFVFQAWKVMEFMCGSWEVMENDIDLYKINNLGSFFLRTKTQLNRKHQDNCFRNFL